MDNSPFVSIVIPTHNRCVVLERNLRALGNQTYPVELTEVLVIADGCTDGTVEMLRQYKASFTLQVLEQTQQGPAQARNYGASCAKGSLLIFLDDDIEASPSLVEAHVKAHENKSEQVIIGYLPPALPLGRVDFFQMGLRAWWEDKFYEMQQPGYRYSYRDLISGNFSMQAGLFAQVGKFDPALRCHEDYELGMRLIKAGATFCFVAEALGYHHEIAELEHAFRRKYEEGKADVMLGQRHPELRPLLPMARLGAYFLSGRLLRALAFRRLLTGDIVARLLRLTLDLLQWARVRGLWQRLCKGSFDYWYCRGVGGELGTRSAIASFLQRGFTVAEADHCTTEIDLREGLEAAEQRLDQERPTSVQIRFGERFIGFIPPQPGAEQLRGAHLRPILLTSMARPMLVAMATEGAIAALIAGTRPIVDDVCRA